MSSSTTLANWWRWLIITTILLMMVGIRLHQLEQHAFRGDEAFTVLYWTTTPLSSDYFDLLKVEPHPIGTLTLYWLWTNAVGTSELAVRLLPTFFNILGGAVMLSLSYKWGKSWRLALIVGILWATHPFLVWHAQDARNYAIVTFTAPLTIYWLWNALEHPQRDISLSVWTPYILAQTLGLYIYLFEGFIVGVGILTISILAIQQRTLLKQAFKVWSIIALLSMPILIQLYWNVFISDYQGTATASSFSALFDTFIPTLWFGDTSTSIAWGGLFTILSVLTLIMTKQRWGLLLGIWAFGPLLMLYVAASFSNIFRPRYVIHVVPAFLLIATVGLNTALRQTSLKKFHFSVTVITAFVILSTSWGELYGYFYVDPPKSPDWRELSAYLEARTTSYDTVLSGSIDPALEYYYSKNITFIPTEMTNPTSLYDQLLAKHDAIYILIDPRTAPSLPYFQENAQVIIGDTYPNISQVRAWKVKPREIVHPLHVQFGDLAILRGYTILDGPHGDTILLLYWEPLSQTENEFSVLLHVNAQPEAPPIAVFDHGVANGTISTTLWPTETIIRDPVPLPNSLSGDFLISIGWYPTNTPEKLLPLNDAELEQIYHGRFVIQMQFQSAP